MKAEIVVNDSPHQVLWGEAFAEGLNRHGVDVVDGDADFRVCWGWAFGQDLTAPRLVLERGYMANNRRMTAPGAWCSAGWDGLNGRADFCNAGANADRWNRYFSDILEPWKDGGNFILLCGQVRGDAAVRQVSLPDWYADAAAHLAHFDLPVVFRPHPRDPCAPPGGVRAVDDREDIATSLADAALVVTYNSNSGVDAILAGVPVIACDEGSMAWPVAAHGLEAKPIKPDRTHWMGRMAYCQWSETEVRRGDAWEHLKAGAA